MKPSVDDYYETIVAAAQTAAPLFNLYGWTYGDGERPPTINELQNTIEELAEKAIERESGIKSGRFHVEYTVYDDERELCIYLELAKKSEYKEFE